MMPQKSTEKTPEDLLWDALTRRDYAAADKVFEMYPAVNVDHKRGKTLFQMAVLLPDLKMVEYLLDKKADINAKTTQHGYTALMLVGNVGAAQHVAAFLLARGADIHAVSDARETALHRAAYMNATDLMRLLIHKGIDIDAKNDMHQTALAIAAERGFVLATDLLLEAGADESIAHTWSGKTPRQKAAECTNTLARPKLEEVFKKHAETPSVSGEKRIRAATAEKTLDTMKKVKSIRFVKKSEGK